MEPFHIRLAALLQQKNGGNRSELARFAGVTPQAAQLWLNGDVMPRSPKLKLIAKFFGISEAELVYGRPDEPSGRRKVAGKYTADEITAAIERLDPAQKKAIVTMLEAYGSL
jgi:transcriptional regulator with XRE-family HTH domain